MFLDRDGTLIADPGYTGDPDAARILPGVPAALASLAGAGYALVIVTNQSAIGRGIASATEVEAVNQRVVDLLRAQNVSIDAVYYCPHHPDDRCECRKPRPGMLLRAAAEMGLDLSASFMIGDKPTDVAAGDAAQCRRSILLTHDANAPVGNSAPDLPAAAGIILRTHER